MTNQNALAPFQKEDLIPKTISPSKITLILIHRPIKEDGQKKSTRCSSKL
jgi:hypothetical protein